MCARQYPPHARCTNAPANPGRQKHSQRVQKGWETRRGCVGQDADSPCPSRTAGGRCGRRSRVRPFVTQISPGRRREKLYHQEEAALHPLELGKASGVSFPTGGSGTGQGAPPPPGEGSPSARLSPRSLPGPGPAASRGLGRPKLSRLFPGLHGSRSREESRARHRWEELEEIENIF